MNPSAVVRTGMYLIRGTVLMLFILQGALFAGQPETTTPSKSIQKTEAASGSGETAPLPDMFLEHKEYDVGEVYEGTAVTHTFIIKNRGKGELVLQSVKPG